MAKTFACPECSTDLGTLSADTRKVNCSQCGMIVVLRKVFGEDWAKSLKPAAKAGAKPKAQAAKSKPKITSRRQRTAEASAEPEEEAKPTRSKKGGRPTRGTKGKATKPRGRRGAKEEVEEPEEGGRRGTRGRRPAASNGVPPMMLWGSIGAVVLVLAGIGIWMSQEDDAPKTAEVVAKTATKNDELDEMMGDSEAPTAGDTKAAATTEPKTSSKPKGKAKKKKLSSREDLTPFENAKGSNAEDNKKAAELVKALIDLDNPRDSNRAGIKVLSIKRAAMPHMINALVMLDGNVKDDVLKGWALMQAIRGACQIDRADYQDFLPSEWQEDRDSKKAKKNTKYRFLAQRNIWKWWTKDGETWQPPVEEEEED